MFDEPSRTSELLKQYLNRALKNADTRRNDVDRIHYASVFANNDTTYRQFESKITP